MTNAEKFQEIFQKFATEVWAFPEKDFLTWLNAEYREPTTRNDLAHNLCDSCTNIGCEFQSGIVRTECAFYMPPHIEPDNCGNYVVQEPTTKNDLGVDCISRADVNRIICEYRDDATETGNERDLERAYGANAVGELISELPSVTPQLSVPEVTALAEWTAKLTKASEDAYNKGYADGVKSVNICPHCGEYIGEEE